MRLGPRQALRRLHPGQRRPDRRLQDEGDQHAHEVERRIDPAGQLGREGARDQRVADHRHATEHHIGEPQELRDGRDVERDRDVDREEQHPVDQQHPAAADAAFVQQIDDYAAEEIAGHDGDREREQGDADRWLVEMGHVAQPAGGPEARVADPDAQREGRRQARAPEDSRLQHTCEATQFVGQATLAAAFVTGRGEQLVDRHGDGDGGESQEHLSPVEVDQQPLHRACRHRSAQPAERHHDGVDQRQAADRPIEDVGLEAAHQRDGQAEPDQGAADAQCDDILTQGKDDGTQRGGQQHDRRHAPGPEAIEGNTGGKLGHHEGGEIHRGHDSDGGIVQAELTAQRGRDHGIERTEEKAQEIAEGKRQERRQDELQERSPVLANTALAWTMRSSPTFR